MRHVASSQLQCHRGVVEEYIDPAEAAYCKIDQRPTIGSLAQTYRPSPKFGPMSNVHFVAIGLVVHSRLP